MATQPGVCTIRLELATFLLHGPTDNTVTDLGKWIISVYLAIAVLCRWQVHHRLSPNKKVHKEIDIEEHSQMIAQINYH